MAPEEEAKSLLGTQQLCTRVAKGPYRAEPLARSQSSTWTPRIAKNTQNNGPKPVKKHPKGHWAIRLHTFGAQVGLVDLKPSR